MCLRIEITIVGRVRSLKGRDKIEGVIHKFFVFEKESSMDACRVDGACKKYAEKGYCKYGDSCNFVHAKALLGEKQMSTGKCVFCGMSPTGSLKCSEDICFV